MKTPRQLKSTEIKSLRNWILHKKQDNKCLICGNEPKRPCLDHDHKKRIKGTGLIRGVLCSTCNVFIAKSENNCVRYGIKIKDLPTILRSVADYLEKDQYPYIHPSEKPKDKHLKKNSIKKLRKFFEHRYPHRKVPEQLKFHLFKSGKKKGKEQPKKLTKFLETLYKEFSLEPDFKKG